MNIKSAIWNSAFTLLFVCLVVTGMWYLYMQGLLTRYIALGDFFLLALAIFRLVRLVSYDVITKFIRDAVKDAPADTFLGTFSQLIHCPWCTGLWFSFFVVFFYYATPFAWTIILILALAGIASLFQIFSNLVGWSAEHKKRTVITVEESKTTCG